VPDILVRATELHAVALRAVRTGGARGALLGARHRAANAGRGGEISAELSDLMIPNPEDAPDGSRRDPPVESEP